MLHITLYVDGTLSLELFVVFIVFFTKNEVQHKAFLKNINMSHIVEK